MVLLPSPPPHRPRPVVTTEEYGTHVGSQIPWGTNGSSCLLYGGKGPEGSPKETCHHRITVTVWVTQEAKSELDSWQDIVVPNIAIPNYPAMSYFL